MNFLWLLLAALGILLSVAGMVFPEGTRAQDAMFSTALLLGGLAILSYIWWS